MNAYIKTISYILPKKVVTNEDLVKEFPEWSVHKIANKIGIDERRIANENETSGDLALLAGKKLFKEHTINLEDIDFLLFCTQTPDYFLPTTACILQHKLGLKKSIGALDFNLGCSGYVYGLSLAKGLIEGGMAKNILLITAETYSKIIHPKDKKNRTIFGDAASASLISNTGFAKIKNFTFGTDGTGAQNLCLRNRAFRNPTGDDDFYINEKGDVVSPNHLEMKGKAIFNFTTKQVPILVEDTLKKNKTKIKEVDYFVFHQANQYILNSIRESLSIPEEKCPIYMREVGNTVSNTIPIVLSNYKSSFNSGDKVLLAGFGVGYSWGGTILDIL